MPAIWKNSDFDEMFENVKEINNFDKIIAYGPIVFTVYCTIVHITINGGFYEYHSSIEDIVDTARIERKEVISAVKILVKLGYVVPTVDNIQFMPRQINE